MSTRQSQSLYKSTLLRELLTMIKDKNDEMLEGLNGVVKPY